MTTINIKDRQTLQQLTAAFDQSLEDTIDLHFMIDLILFLGESNNGVTRKQFARFLNHNEGERASMNWS